MSYEELLIEAMNNGLKVYENINFESNSKGLIKGEKIALSSKLKTDKEKVCILAEEISHSKITVGNIINQKSISSRKQEYKARLDSFNNLVGLVGIINAYRHRCNNLYEMAEYLDVTEEFLNEALTCYREKYGRCVAIDNYVIFFEPELAVIENI